MNRYQKLIDAIPRQEGLEGRVLDSFGYIPVEASRPRRPFASAIAAGLVLFAAAGCFTAWKILGDSSEPAVPGPVLSGTASEVVFGPSVTGFLEYGEGVLVNPLTIDLEGAFTLEEINLCVYINGTDNGILQRFICVRDLEANTETVLPERFINAEVGLEPTEDAQTFKLMLLDSYGEKAYRAGQMGTVTFYKNGYVLDIEPDYEGLIWVYDAIPNLTPYGEGECRQNTDLLYRGGYSDITPAGLYEETGCRVVKCEDSSGPEPYETFLLNLPGGSDTYLGSGFGGFGVDPSGLFYLEDAKLLVYSYTCGSGISRTMIGVFDLKEQLEYTIPGAFIGAVVHLSPTEYSHVFQLKREKDNHFGTIAFYAAGYVLDISPDYEGQVWDTEQDGNASIPPTQSPYESDTPSQNEYDPLTQYKTGRVTVSSGGVDYEPYINYMYGAEMTENGLLYSDGAPVSYSEIRDTLPQIQYSPDFKVSIGDGDLIAVSYAWYNELEMVEIPIPQTSGDELMIPNDSGVYFLRVKVMWGVLDAEPDAGPYTVNACFFSVRIE